MKKKLLQLSLIFFVFFYSNLQKIHAQCTNTTLYPSATATIAHSTTLTTITTVQYAGEYNNQTLTAAATGDVYVFTSSVATDYITLRDNTGTIVLASGVTPLSYTQPAVPYTSVQMHTNTNAACGTQATSRTTSAGLGTLFSYGSSTTTQPSTSTAAQGTVNVQILRIDVAVTGNYGTALSLTNLDLGLGTTTLASDITTAKVYYTGTSTTFATTTQFGSNVSSPGATFSVTGSQALSSGTNYFWLVYDLSCAATATDVIDGACTGITVGSVYTPTITNPTGTRTITALYAPTYTNSTAGNYQQGTVNDQKVYINISGSSLCPANATSVTFNTGTSTNPAADILQAKCYYTTTSTFAATTPFGSAVATPNGAITFTGTQALASGTGNYFWLVYDISCSAAVADSINATVTNIIVGGNTYVPTGTSYSRHAVSALYAPTYTNSTAGNYQQGAVNATKAYINISGATACPANATSVTFNTGTSTNPAADIAQAKCFYTTTSTFATTTPFGSPVATPSGVITFTGTQALANGSGNYFWLVYDVSCTATVTDSINATVTNIVVGGNTYVPTGTSYSKHAVSILYAPTYTNTTAGNYQQGAVNASKAYINISGSALCPANTTSVTFNTGTSTNPAADIAQAKCYYTTTSTFNTATAFGSPIATPSGAMTFTGTQALAAGSGNYFWLVYDVNCAAVALDSINATVTNIVVGGNTYVPTGTSYSKHAVVASIPGDFITTASTLVFGTGATNAFAVLGKTLEASEPSPILNSQGGGSSGASNYSWGTAASSTQWYKLVVPSSGYGSSGNLAILADTTTGSSSDTQIALWDFPSMTSGCGVAPNFTGAKLLAANDDRIESAQIIAPGETVAGGLNSVIRVKLIPGGTYYLQIDGYSTGTPSGNIFVYDLGQAPYSMANNGLGNYFNPNGGTMRYASYEVNSPDGWTYYYTNSGTANTLADDSVLVALKWDANSSFYYNGTYASGTEMVNHVKRSAQSTTAPSALGTFTSADSLIVWSGRLAAPRASIDLKPTAPYVTSPNWWMLNKFWSVTPFKEPTNSVGVRYFYSDADYNALVAAVTGGGGALVAHTDMKFIKATKSLTSHYTNAELDPGAATTPHSALLAGTVTNTIPWTYTANVETGADNIHQAQFNVTAFSGGGGGSTGQPLVNPVPIKVEYFRGTKQGVNNLLDWKVSCTNTPSATLTLERSADARSFSSVYTINATALRCLQPFSYSDATALAGMNYYRLKMTDAYGVTNYSSIVALLNKDKGFEIVNITPNPVTDGTFKLNITTAQQTKMEVVITDVQGRVMSKQSLTLTAGFNAIDMNVSNLAKGTYQLFGNIADGRTKTLSFVKQ